MNRRMFDASDGFKGSRSLRGYHVALIAISASLDFTDGDLTGGRRCDEASMRQIDPMSRTGSWQSSDKSHHATVDNGVREYVNGVSPHLDIAVKLVNWWGRLIPPGAGTGSPSARIIEMLLHIPRLTSTSRLSFSAALADE